MWVCTRSDTSARTSRWRQAGARAPRARGWVALRGQEGLGEPGPSLLAQGESFCLIWKTVDLGSQGKGDPAASPGLGGTAWGRKGLGEKGAVALGEPAAVLTPGPAILGTPLSGEGGLVLPLLPCSPCSESRCAMGLSCGRSLRCEGR